MFRLSSFRPSAFLPSTFRPTYNFQSPKLSTFSNLKTFNFQRLNRQTLDCQTINFCFLKNPRLEMAIALCNGHASRNQHFGRKENSGGELEQPPIHPYSLQIVTRPARAATKQMEKNYLTFHGCVFVKHSPWIGYIFLPFKLGRKLAHDLSFCQD